MNTRSTSAPNSGAITPITRISDSQTGTPHDTWICQYMNAASIPKAPWAKLKMPEVV